MLRTGKVLPGRLGGDTRLGLIETYHGFIRTLIETNPYLTLDEISDALAARGTSVSAAVRTGVSRLPPRSVRALIPVCGSTGCP